MKVAGSSRTTVEPTAAAPAGKDKAAQEKAAQEKAAHAAHQSDAEEKYLIATSEQPISAMHKDEYLDEDELPIR